MSATDTPTTPAASSQPADTYDWDTAYGIHFRDVNAAIVSAKSSPPSFTGTFTDDLSGTTYDVAGTFGDWQLTGGSGDIVHMTLPVTTGTVTPQGVGNALQYIGTAIVEVYLNFLPQPTNADGSGTKNNLKVKTTTSDPVNQPVASVQSFTLSPNSPSQKVGDAVKQALGSWLTKNLQQFNHVFSVVDIGVIADKGAFQWLKPTHIGYAVNTDGATDPGDYIFGVLAMTENRTNPKLSSQISPNIIPAGANSGFLISQERFVDKIVKSGAYLLFSGASADDFTPGNDGTSVTNRPELTFQKFTLKDGTLITDAKVPAGKFLMTAFDQALQIQFTNLSFTFRTGYIAHLDYTSMQHLYLDKNGHMQMKQPDKPYKPSLAVSVTKTTEEKWVEIVEGVLEGVALTILGALIGGALGTAVDAAEEAAEGAVTDAAEFADDEGAGELNFDINGLSDDEIDNLDEVESESESSAADDLNNAGDDSYASKFKGWFSRNWPKMLGGILGGTVGVVLSEVPTILEAYAEKNLDQMPTLDAFADQAVSPTQWPNSGGAKLVSLSLNRSLQMGVQITFNH